jgi:hypothetical protein
MLGAKAGEAADTAFAAISETISVVETQMPRRAKYDRSLSTGWVTRFCAASSRASKAWVTSHQLRPWKKRNTTALRSRAQRGHGGFQQQWQPEPISTCRQSDAALARKQDFSDRIDSDGLQIHSLSQEPAHACIKIKFRGSWL